MTVRGGKIRKNELHRGRERERAREGETIYFI